MRQFPKEEVLQREGTQMLRKYVARQQETVAEWVATRPIFVVCARETGFEGGVRLRVRWWRYNKAENQIRVTVEDI